ncbi:hypothetical protein HHI36_016483 [Cryptolaemus montrouzieri]|uniref:Uncharacterized protein n=1 Tax=Cryptolaemus montrouzieri TaxID=559131 RepID=A0ABD2NK90_9CUCU
MSTPARSAEEYDAVLLGLPSNITHELEPQAEAVFRSSEHFWDENPDRRSTKDRFAGVFTPVWEKKVSVANITLYKWIRSTSIYQFNASAIPEEAFAPSTLSGRIFEADSSSDDDIPFSEVRRHIIANRKKSTNYIKPTPGSSGVQRKLLLKSTKTQQENTEKSTNGTEPAPGPSGVQQTLPFKSRDTQKENTVLLKLSPL